jgi:parallel beta-helix repeat protein
VDDDFSGNNPAARKFVSIQAAVNAASPGDTIQVRPGTYTEQVTIPATKDDLTLKSQTPQSAVIKAPATLTGPVVRVAGADDVEIEGFTVTGPAAGVTAGIQVDQGGSAEVSKNLITDIRPPGSTGLQNGIGVLVGGQGSATDTGDAVVVDNTITRYQKEGVTVTGAGSRALIADNTITGTPSPLVAQNGIDVQSGADAAVLGNTIKNNQYLPTNPADTTIATGVLLFQAGDVLVAGNRVLDNQEGIVDVQTDGAAVLLNQVSDSLGIGVDLFGAKNLTVAGNVVTDNGTAGIFLQDVTGSTVALNLSRGNQTGVLVTGASSGNGIRFNDLRGNTGFDAFDDTTGTGTAGTANTWAGNRFDDASPTGLR